MLHKCCIYSVIYQLQNDFVGPYQIDVNYEECVITGSPFSCIAYDYNAVRVSPIESVTLGKTVDFSGNRCFLLSIFHCWVWLHCFFMSAESSGNVAFYKE